MSWDQTMLRRQKSKQGVERAEKDVVGQCPFSNHWPHTVRRLSASQPFQEGLITTASFCSCSVFNGMLNQTCLQHDMFFKKMETCKHLCYLDICGYPTDSRKPDLSMRYETWFFLFPQKNWKETECSRGKRWRFTCLAFCKAPLPLLKKKKILTKFVVEMLKAR